MAVHDLDRIDYVLTHNRLNSTLFERFATDVLIDRFPLLNPVPGGTDSGRDADVRRSTDGRVARLMATASRTLNGVIANMRRGVKSQREHGYTIDSLVLISPASLSGRDKEKVQAAARKLDIKLDVADIFEREFVASVLRRDGEWRERLLGLSSEPISLSRVPPSLAESPWGYLTLTGRETDVEALSTAGDIIVSGFPGIGKSRILREISGAMFVDSDCSENQIAQDLRWLKPSTVVLDDAGLTVSTLSRLIAYRRAEPDIFGYRLIASCWPDDLKSLLYLKWKPAVHELDLLERVHIDRVIRSMGITGELARTAILEQAEGRVGWAVSLSDVLRRKNDPNAIITGSALFGYASDHLRRIGATEALDALTLVSLAGGCTSDELTSMSENLEISRRELTNLLERSATSGLLDVTASVGANGPVRHYAVRPPALATAIVADRIFRNAFPSVDLAELIRTWPSRLSSIANQVVLVASAGISEAIPTARNLFRACLQVADIADLNLLSGTYLNISRDCSDEVVSEVTKRISESRPDSSRGLSRDEPLVDICFRALHRWSDREAAKCLLRLAVSSATPAADNSASASRRLVEAIKSFHPEARYRESIREVVCSEFVSWLTRDKVEASENYGLVRKLAAAILNPELESFTLDPADGRTLSVRHGTLPPHLSRELLESMWPQIAQLSFVEYPGLADGVIDSINRGLRIGRGLDEPSGYPSTSPEQQTIYEGWMTIAREVAVRSDLFPGLLARLSWVSSWAGEDIGVEFPDDDLRIFLESRDLASGTKGNDDYEKRLRAHVAEWNLAPKSAIPWLKSVKTELARAELTWPPRIAIACEELAKRAGSSAPELLDLAIRESLLPEGLTFLSGALSADGVEIATVESLLSNELARECVIRTVLDEDLRPAAVSRLSDQIRCCVIESLKSDDLSTLELIFLRGEAPAATIEEMLGSSSPQLSASAAVALSQLAYIQNGDLPDLHRGSWIRAVQRMRLGEVELGRNLDNFMDLCLKECPDAIGSAVTNMIIKCGGQDVFHRIPGGCWDRLAALPAAIKTSMLLELASHDTDSEFLMGNLIGDDTTWVSSCIVSQLISVRSVLNALWIRDRVDVERWAPLLIMNGVSPSSVARLREFEAGFGERSERYAELVRYFENLSHSPDPSMVRVAEAGIEIFTQQRDEALAKERQCRVRGL